MSIFEGFLSTSETLGAFSDRAFVDAMLRFEAALARAQAAEGLIPESAAHSIVSSCKVELFDVAKIVRESGRAGSVAIPLVKALREAVSLFNADAAPYVHFGSTSQDVIDSAMALVTREAVALIETDLAKAADALLRLATQHAETPMLARTLMQPASVTSFGFKCAGWAAPLVRSRLRLREAAKHALQLQLGGAVGTLAQMKGQGAAVRQRMAKELGLGDPGATWHTQRDEWVALGCELGLVTGSLGKIAVDIALLGQYEVAEVSEPSEPGRGGSSAMPHKRNPVASMVAIAAAHRAPQRVAALLGAMPQQHERALGAWQAELAEWPQLLMSAHGSVRAMAGALPGLQVDAARMRANIDRLRAELPRDAADEWFDPALAHNAGQTALAEVKALQARLDADKELSQ
ncbi:MULTISPECIES: 3-carboxy-cis,cis-muconate cycloisomerase [Variovorax]|jgi:3-carboxy-cis,cis-muconate cycloisomerase|uniref:3-carboxy-cis,cis-muconate cycloisomerase n=1 Tax=Variovorax TaxID=34072 RepID=UPI0008687F77|nr:MULTISPECIES: 3-carboxy-cis,cis-muconate cycloisomerase [Variovorax]MBN8751754.1 3-carboxy-cis,cis-muconate cycloisomerase [Variovorax sp.]ODU13334.1 MAG: 3-carboxy-cis,cis-muconate cycloisomerase [Variovorax sp. SCN 67-85]ODV16221.1 MAG: 3-carboxy-cis,cis-muconate cycloisomerase [Variovorax sp. SCN 67-20]OJZ11669.1 MAG: 3-carboxy-cis,cis-muconate cycloisomerase [Variovorax sp. 67-131]UKI05661.1 3-carboxy-cis,cis-muconate cycloisomerase [Variovorax paradoxus]